ncbi:MAG TPA: hypothetical protein VFV67_07075, partial [Actinophytocola sp.]|uniref:hypothetical protein n=1 Tax=Actinophytocola sp. TaxID=1872138 RepID=UPI002DC03730
MDGQMQVVYEPINAAVPQLNKQVGVLDNGHGTLTARQVPAEAFARVDASAQAASTHANTVAENARLLKAAAGRLDGIIGEMRGTVTA